MKGGLAVGKKRGPHEYVRPVSYLRVANVQRGFLSLDEVKTIAATEAEIKELCLRDGDILFNEGGDRDKLGRGWVWSGELPECIHQNHVFRARLRTPEIVPKLVSMYANWFGQAYFLGQGKQTTNLASINLKTLSKFPFPLPPVNEQRRIVAKLEALLARSRRAKRALDAVPTLLERFRQSVLAAAFHGDLTQDWREANPNVEPASKLLERIRSERRRCWEEAELERMRAKGKVPGDDRWKERYEAAAPVTETTAHLPDGWAWATVDELAEETVYGTSAKTNDNSTGVPVLRMGNLQNGKLQLADLKYLPKDHGEFPELLLKPGDMLFNRTNSPELVGKTAVYCGEPRFASFASYLLRVRVIHHSPLLLSHFINSPAGRDWVASVVSQQVGQANVNGTKLRALVIPVPPLDEQHAIVARIDEALSRTERVMEVAREQARRLQSLEQALLSKAFRGELVPQDPSDEPASDLLMRIGAERAKPADDEPNLRPKRRRETKVA
ncbi:hypothetical protein HMI51_27115 [Corallococcus coralloides]|nr:hypothetical protein [Corallococcus coralloides]